MMTLIRRLVNANLLTHVCKISNLKLKSLVAILKNRGRRRSSIAGRMMLAGGEGEVLEQARTCAHPCVDELLPEMAGEGLPTCTGDLQRRTWRQATFRRVL